MWSGVEKVDSAGGGSQHRDAARLRQLRALLLTLLVAVSAAGPLAAARAARCGEPPRTRRRAGSNGARAIDAVGLHPYVGYLPPHCQPFRHLTTCAHSSVLPSSASPQPRPAGGNARAPGVAASPITNPTTRARSIPPSRPTCRRVRW